MDGLDFPYVVALEGGSNFRDLGGHRTADGRIVRRGTVFRSAHLGGLTDVDRTALGKLGVHWADVMEDYLRTNALWTGHVGRYPELDLDTRAAIVEARQPYLEAAFAVVRDDFGSADAFAEQALGLDAAARERLKMDLLT